MICFRILKPKKLKWNEVVAPLINQGYSRILQDGNVEKLGEFKFSDSTHKWVVVVQDRLKLSDVNRGRFLESAGTAQHYGDGAVEVYHDSGEQVGVYTRGLHSAKSGREFRDKSAALFSFNSPIGACPKCRGFGRVIEIDYGLVIPDRSLSIDDGAIRAFSGEVYQESLFDLQRACRKKKIPTHIPWSNLSAADLEFVMEGEPGYQQGDFERQGHWYGVRRFFQFLEQNTYKMHVRVFLSKYRSYVDCPDCGGTRLQPESLYWKWEGLRLPDLYEMPVQELHEWIRGKSSAIGNAQVDSAREAILNRLSYLNDVGLGYLTLNRSSRTLSGGEVERVNLTACLGTKLTDTLFVLDEPSVGLHSRDIERLIRILQMLTGLGNTVVLVEHDESVMRAADHLIEIGPRRGATEGRLCLPEPMRTCLSRPTLSRAVI